MNSLFKEAQFSAYKRNSKYEKAISPYIKYEHLLLMQHAFVILKRRCKWCFIGSRLYNEIWATANNGLSTTIIIVARLEIYSAAKYSGYVIL